MPTNRTPINRPPPTTRITPEAVATFKQMLEARDGSQQWWDLHVKLHHELKLAPWQWPAVVRPDEECDYRPGSGGASRFPQAQRLYRELAARVAQPRR
jgi:hypothetical protein